MKASLESSVNMYQSTRLNFQEELEGHKHGCENLKSRTTAMLGESINIFQFAIHVDVYRQLEVHITAS
jgi:hypothetical protein